MTYSRPTSDVFCRFTGTTKPSLQIRSTACLLHPLSTCADNELRALPIWPGCRAYNRLRLQVDLPKTPAIFIEASYIEHESNREKFRGGNLLRPAHHFAIFPRLRTSVRLGGSFRLSPRVTTSLATHCTSRRTMRSTDHCFPSTIHEHSCLGWSRFGQKPCDSRRLEGSGVFTTPITRFGGPAVFSRRFERSLLETTPLSRTSDTPVAFTDQTVRGVSNPQSPPVNAEDRSDL